MLINVSELGVQSYCFREFKSNREVIKRVKECGLSVIELCGVHADFANEAACDEVIAVYRESGVRIVSIGVQGLADDEKKEEKYFEFARRAGARFMAVDFNPARMPACFRTAERLADKYDLRLAIHNHGGTHWLGSAAMLETVFRTTSPRIGLCLDTAWALHSHEDPSAMVERFSQRLYGIHVKDFVFDRAGRHADVVVGTGNLALPRLKAAMDKAGFKGYWVLEYEGEPNDPVPAIQQCVAQIKKEFGHE
jgi:sugar phosphate isomerase/epimerase